MRNLLKGAACAAALMLVPAVAAPLFVATAAQARGYDEVTPPSTTSTPTPVDQLAKPPADARQWLIVSKAGVHGHSFLWTAPDGTRMVRESLNLRGQVFEQDSAVVLGSDGMPQSFVIRGFTPNGDAAETFKVAGGKAEWKSQVDAGHAGYSAPAMYVAAGGPFLSNLFLVEALTTSPTHSVNLLPGGKATAEKVGELTVGQGANQKKIICWAISGLGNSPQPLWTTEDGKFFGFTGGLGLLPAGYEGDLSAITDAQDKIMSSRAPVLAHQLARTPAGAVAFTHVRAFVDGKRFADDQTVVVDKGIITAVGPANAIKIPAGAEVIQGKGETLVPGLWDSHQHVGDDYSGPFLLSLGVTSARDPGNDNELTLSRAKRRAAGDLIMPHVYPSVLIDGKGPMSAQVGTVVTSEEEAIKVVDSAAARGFTGIKFYGTYNPAWVAPAAAEAHKLGLHVHGHLPAGMRTSQAIDAGYDEITHIYFVMMEAMPDDIVKTSNGINRFQGTGKYAKDVDLNKEPMKSLIAKMANKHIVSDPTLVVAEGLFVPENGDVGAAYAPYMGTMPPATERGFRQGGFTVDKGYTREDYRKSFRKLVDLVGAMHKAGVPIVAGTDGSGMELVRELELYREAGFTPEEALDAATLVPAHNVHADKTTGSITVGKVADLVLVEGDPSKRIGDLRNTRTVMMDGKLMDADALRSASGFSGRPHPAR